MYCCESQLQINFSFFYSFLRVSQTHEAEEIDWITWVWERSKVEISNWNSISVKFVSHPFDFSPTLPINVPPISVRNDSTILSVSISHYLRLEWDIFLRSSRKLKLHRGDKWNQKKNIPAKSLRPWQKIFLRSVSELIAWMNLHVNIIEMSLGKVWRMIYDEQIGNAN